MRLLLFVPLSVPTHSPPFPLSAMMVFLSVALPPMIKRKENGRTMNERWTSVPWLPPADVEEHSSYDP
jgi:hypothetical protein